MTTGTKREGNRGRMRRQMAAVVVLAVLGVAVAAGAVTGPVGRVATGRMYGADVALGNGTARVYVDLVEGVPQELGVVLSEAALTGLPTDHSHGGMEMPDGHRMFEMLLPMPSNNPTPYKHVLFGWNPGGHEPAGIYDKPHFDFHFYTIPDADRMAIDPSDPRFDAKANAHPDALFTPAGFVAIPGAVPFMGAHWVNPLTPELNQQPFSQTFLFGSWNGRMIFAEPMITKAYLESRPDLTVPIPVPAQHAEPGYYPSTYRVRWDEKAREYRVALSGFEWRN